MKLLGILKEKFEKAETIEDKKKILAEVGVELTDEELEGVVGGMTHEEAYELMMQLRESGKLPQTSYEQAARAALSKFEQEMRSVARG